MIRVCAGRLKGRRIRVPPKTRPTSDKVREAMFDVLGVRVEGARCLDLFAGSGALGIEALSRGATLAVFCDSRAVCVRTIGENMARLGVEREFFRLIRSDALAAIERLKGDEMQFDLVFVDPPYAEPVYQSVLLALDVSGLVSPSGMVVVERCKRVELGETFGLLQLWKTKHYGDTYVDYFVRMEK